MCGIAGAMSRNGGDVDLALLNKLGAAQAHRGPDGQHEFRVDNIGFAHQRLAIIDLVTGDQPLFGPDGLVLIANGEIYNNPELRAEMADVAFRTQSDCEPPLFLYRRFGLDFVKRLRGMYAIALYDPGHKQLVLCRDPFGIKPLYYAETDSAFLFASEPQAILATGLVARGERRAARDELLALQFTTGRETIFPGIYRVMPGETLVVRGGRIVEQYRQPALPLERPRPSGSTEELDAVLTESVMLHQRSDVPYGMFLSGGIDSASILALMARLNERPVLAFTARFPGSLARDESDLASRLAGEVGAEHVTVPFEEADFWNLLPEIAAHMDDPAADYAILPTYKLAMAAKGSVKVVLSGEGGDELFGGYGRYRHAARMWPFARPMRRSPALQGLANGWRQGIESVENTLSNAPLTRLQRAQAVDCADWLPNDLLGKLDRCLMAHGIEGRVPFLDASVAGLAFRLPDRLKIRNGLGKHLLRKWLSTALPSAQPFSKKRGFTVPVAEWLAAKPELGPLLAAQDCVKAVCPPGAVEALFAAMDRKRGFAAWLLLFYALWHKRHVEAAPLGGNVFESLGG
jgi:asparagine synthase (glutamine-hydrolysing)